MTDSQIKRYSIKKLCEDIARVLTQKQIRSQIKRFELPIVEICSDECKLCNKFDAYDCRRCPYKIFTDDFYKSGCLVFSKIRYDGVSLSCFNPKSRIATLKRYKLALEIKRGNL